MANIKIYKDICDILSDGKAGVLATILNTRGSTPAGSLSKMFVIDGGPEIAGTVGGGRIEADIITEAKSVFTNGKTVRKTYTMNEDDIEGGVICGGEIDVLIEFIKPDLLKIYTELYERCLAGADTIVGTAIDDDQLSLKFLIDREFSIISGNKEIDIESIKPAANLIEKDKVLVIDKNDQRFIFEPVRGLNSLIIFGGGHISKYLADIAGICDFNVTIVDDRSEFASIKRFPNVDKVVCEDYKRSFDGLDINEKTFIVIVTRGHAFDEIALEQAVQTAAGYIGMIGSKKKIRTLYQHLLNRGFDAGSLKNVFAPIGIDIGARTPETIAVSIMAEIIKFRELSNDNPAIHLKEAMKFFFNGS